MIHPGSTKAIREVLLWCWLFAARRCHRPCCLFPVAVVGGTIPFRVAGCNRVQVAWVAFSRTPYEPSPNQAGTYGSAPGVKSGGGGRRQQLDNAFPTARWVTVQIDPPVRA